jgi:hypothetical protein
MWYAIYKNGLLQSISYFAAGQAEHLRRHGYVVVPVADAVAAHVGRCDQCGG